MNYKNIKEGTIVTGKVYQVKDNEVIVVVEGAQTEGTIYLDNLTTKDVKSAKEIVKEGDEIQAEVKKKDDEAGVLLLSRIGIERKEIFEDLQNKFSNEEVFEVVVKDINKGGLIARAYGIDMFMPAREASLEYTEDLSTFKGKTLEVKLIEISRKKIVVSHKAVQREAQREKKQEELKNIQTGDVLEGTVSKLMPYGAFVRFENVEGLLHVSEISHHKVNNPSDLLKEGQAITVKVIDVQGQKRSLSLKALEKTPWEKFAETHKSGDKVSGKVVKKMQFGILVEVEKDVAGIINKQDYSWDPRFNLAGNVNVGDEIEVQILSIDPENRKMQLSKKHLEYNPWEDVNVKVGEEVSGEIASIQSNGALVEVKGVYAFLPIGEIKDERIENVSDVLNEGEVINAVVLKFDRKKWQMVISKKTFDEKKIRDEYKKHLKSENQEDQSQTLGELFADKFKNFNK